MSDTETSIITKLADKGYNEVTIRRTMNGWKTYGGGFLGMPYRIANGSTVLSALQALLRQVEGNGRL